MAVTLPAMRSQHSRSVAVPLALQFAGLLLVSGCDRTSPKPRCNFQLRSGDGFSKGTEIEDTAIRLPKRVPL